MIQAILGSDYVTKIWAALTEKGYKIGWSLLCTAGNGLELLHACEDPDHTPEPANATLRLEELELTADDLHLLRQLNQAFDPDTQ